MASIEKLVRNRQKKGELKSLTLIETRSGKWQASLDYKGKSYAVHVADDPLECLKYVLEDDTDARIRITREYRDQDTASSVAVPDEQRRAGRPVELRHASVPKGEATIRQEPLNDIDMDDLLS